MRSGETVQQNVPGLHGVSVLALLAPARQRLSLCERQRWRRTPPAKPDVRVQPLLWLHRLHAAEQADHLWLLAMVVATRARACGRLDKARRRGAQYANVRPRAGASSPPGYRSQPGLAARLGRRSPAAFVRPVQLPAKQSVPHPPPSPRVALRAPFLAALCPGAQPRSLGVFFRSPPPVFGPVAGSGRGAPAPAPRPAERATQETAAHR